MSQPGFAVRSLHPERTAPQILEAHAARSKAVDEMIVFTDENYPGLTPVFFSAFDGSFSTEGRLAAKEGLLSDFEVPKGMRLDNKEHEFAPAKKTDEGKALAKRWSKFGFSMPRIDGLGGIIRATNDGPDVASHMRRNCITGWSFSVFNRADGSTEVFATIGLARLLDKNQNRVIDEDGTWERVRISAFHLAREENQDITANQKANAS